MRRIPLFLATAACLFVWGRLVYATITQPSPAREVTFVDLDGTPADRLNCHGPAWVIDGTIWAMCSAQKSGRDFLTRYDLDAGTALKVREVPAAHWRGISAAVRHPEGGLVIVQGEGKVTRWKPDGAWVDLQLPGDKRSPCIVWHRGAVELAYGDGTGQAFISRLTPAGWQTRTTPGPARTAGVEQRFEGCEHQEGQWRLTWLRHPRTFGAGPVPVELHEQMGIPGAPAPTVTLHLDPQAKPTRVHVNRVAMVENGLLTRTGGVHRWSGPPSLERAADGTWHAPAIPPGATPIIARYDHVFGGPRPGSILSFDLGARFARIQGRWFSASNARIWQMSELSPDLSGAAHQGPPVVAQFWLSIGFKMLPKADGGYWMMGSLGEAYVHLDADLRRTDELSLIERFKRAFTVDRAKRNSDFYYSLAELKKVGFLWALFALPLLLAITRRRMAVGAFIYLVGLGMGWIGWWKLTGVFW